MKHARPDYDRIQDPAGLIPDDEPVFLFRAQDKHFIAILSRYRQLVRQDKDHDKKILDAIDRHVLLARKWPKRKAPDMP